MRNILPAVALFATLTLVSGKIDRHDVAGAYVTENSKPLCHNKVSILLNSTSIPAASIKIDNETCTGATLTLVKATKNTNPFTEFLLESSEIGNFYTSDLSQNLVCGNATIKSGEKIFLLKPNRDVKVSEQVHFALEQFLGIKDLLDRGLTLAAGKMYLITGFQCVYFRDVEKESTGIIGSILNAATECFPGKAKVQLRSGKNVSMRHLTVGDEVLVSQNLYSEVFAWTHQDEFASSTFVQLTDSSGKSLTVTPGHFVYANGKISAARDVRVGHTLQNLHGKIVVVDDVSFVTGRGLYNPQTVHGDIVVDGFVATTYTEAIQPLVAHALLAPIRAAFRFLSFYVGVSMS